MVRAPTLTGSTFAPTCVTVLMLFWPSCINYFKSLAVWNWDLCVFFILKRAELELFGAFRTD